MGKKLFSFFIAAAMAFVISFGGAACIATGFLLTGEEFPGLDPMLPANLGTVGLLCGLLSLAVAGYFCLPKRKRYLPIILALGLALVIWRREPISAAIEAILYRMTSVYNMAYGWGALQWTGGSPGAVAPDWGLFLLVSLPGIMAARSVCCGKSRVAAVLVSILPLAFCLVVTNTVPDNWCLLLVLTGLLLMILSVGLRKRDVFSANALCALLLIPVLLFQSVLFWAIPRDTYEARMNGIQQYILSWFQDLPFVQMGADGNLKLEINGGDPGAAYVDLSAVGPKWELTFPVMEVTAPRDGTLYLRGQAMEVYDGKSWRPVAINGKDGWPSQSLKEVGKVTVATRTGHELLYFPYYPGGGRWTEDAIFDQGYLKNPNWDTTYTFQQMEMTEPGYVVLSERLRKQCLQLPRETLNRAQEYLKQMPEASLQGSTEVIAQAVADLVKNSATYDLNTQRMPFEESDFALWFLESSDTGYCVHFASAATVLLRAAGVPARYVSGYALTATAGQPVTVTAGQAHAWVEYFDSSWGWRVLEATPAAQGPETPATETTETEPSVPETTGEEQTKPTLRPGIDPTEAPTEPSVTAAPSSPDEDPRLEERAEISWEAVNILVGMLLAAVLVAGQYILRRGLRLREMSTGNVNRRALEQWREIMRLCRILKWSPPEQLLELAEKAKFSQHTLTTEERREFRLFLDHAGNELAKKPFLLRTLIRLIWAVG